MPDRAKLYGFEPFVVWNRRLSDEEIKMLADDPYCFLHPAGWKPSFMDHVESWILFFSLGLKDD